MTDDGVYGLQRGLKKAGVNAMILSLWSVDDYATGELMKRFYENLVSGLPTYQAFMQARQTIISQNVTTSGKFSAATLTKKKKTNLNKSRYVNAFIMIDVL
jgi:CHAT domain-containing protein